MKKKTRKIIEEDKCQDCGEFVSSVELKDNGQCCEACAASYDADVEMGDERAFYK